MLCAEYSSEEVENVKRGPRTGTTKYTTENACLLKPDPKQIK